ncbi:alpha/beta hydrolase [Nocardioides donggukensis]|uniref:Alpha/beta hydrolase n=1 Tax=Nocardioides donggukensis TaxID=2774019 RepID=A0A927K3H9_9ACTN|nr:alpha/beta hydrolase [Nocardioides donggukensis]MBD8868295.1 alpha/beta hydrolase [Nocardioides donggukensis]
MDTTTTPAPPSIVLIPGHWLGAWAWDAVAADLRSRGHQVTALTLPGLDPDDPRRAEATLSRQADAVRAAVGAAGRDGAPVVLVAHSGAGHPTSVALDRDPGAVARIVYVDSGPAADGSAFDASLPDDVDEVALPPFDRLGEQASLDGLAEEDLERFRRRAVPEPGPVLREPTHLVDDRRRDIPATIIACSMPSEVMWQMAREGHPMLAEVGTLRELDVVDLRTGHWPMWSRPADLAAAISAAACR